MVEMQTQKIKPSIHKIFNADLFCFKFQSARVESGVFHRKFRQHSSSKILADEVDVLEDGHNGKLGIVYTEHLSSRNHQRIAPIHF